MAVIFNQPKRTRGHARALPVPDLNQPGRLRVGHLMTLYGMSHSALYANLKKHLLPPSDGRVGKRQYWKPETIKAHLEQ